MEERDENAGASGSAGGAQPQLPARRERAKWGQPHVLGVSQLQQQRHHQSIGSAPAEFVLGVTAPGAPSLAHHNNAKGALQ